MKIAYEKHPVSPARKAELVAQGFKIMDARYKPDAEADSYRKADIPTREEIAKMPKADVVEWLDALGVDGAKGKVSDLRKTLCSAMYLEV